jgi:hypothetical protein
VHNVGYQNSALGVGVNRSHSDSTDIHFGGSPAINPAQGWAVRFTNLVQNAYAGISLGGSNFLIENGTNCRSFGSLDNLGESLFRRGGGNGTHSKISGRGFVTLLSLVKLSIRRLVFPLFKLQTQT